MRINSQRVDTDGKEIYMLAKRDNNTSRGYLLVNPLQGKHMPVHPNQALTLFRQLGKRVKNACQGEKVLIIGFAETATAIGAAVAKAVGNSSWYIHTTREALPEEYTIVEFSEEHSHATEQRLCCKNWAEITAGLDRIVFVEDEVTTGKTVLNFIDALINGNLITGEMKISVASIINGMSGACEEQFKLKGINSYYLFKIDNTYFERDVSKYDISFFEEDKEEDKIESRQADIITMHFGGRLDPRTGVLIDDYQKACGELAHKAMQSLKNWQEQSPCPTVDLLADKKILVLGTEEFMYPAICLGQKIQARYSGAGVYVHATTRSPILPHHAPDYPIKSRHRLKSVYCDGRQTYIYNLQSYDTVLVVTDSQKENGIGMGELCDCLSNAGNERIAIIKWVNS